MRAFIAIELPEAIKDRLADAGASLRQAGIKASWIKTGNMHLTLRFLADISEQDILRLSERLRVEYEGTESFTLNVEGLGAFPNLRRPSVIWAGLSPLEGPLSQVQEVAESAAREIGLEPDKKKFHPHLTLARIRDRRKAGDVAAEVERLDGFSGGEITVSSVSLFSSKLRPDGPLHTKIEEFVF